MVIDHPPPSNAVIKQLYARAFSCAFPGCTEPLYREDKVSGTWLLNSRICHICARSKGGPRWDEEQSSEQNRSIDNLVLMCIKHASTIDDIQSQQSFSPILLREWKAEQLAEHRRRSEGWPLTTKMADEALIASSGAAILIKDSILHLGGRGGEAPGAGGGGGGAIGNGARAGRGGNGGRLTDLNGDPLPPDEIEKLRGLMSEDRIPPGAGGGGAGAIGPGVVSGDGGDGGDGMGFAADVTPGDMLDIEVGEGGKGSRQPGQHPTAAADTVIRHRTAEGVLIREYRVSGGKSPKSGRLPDDWKPITHADLDGGFQISTLMTVSACDFAMGRLHLLGGAWDKFPLPYLPYDATWHLICIAGWHEIEPDRIRGLQVCLTNPENEEVSRIAVQLPPTALSEITYIWQIQIGTTFNREGIWSLHVQSGEYILSRISIKVLVMSQFADGQRPTA